MSIELHVLYLARRNVRSLEESRECFANVGMMLLVFDTPAIYIIEGRYARESGLHHSIPKRRKMDR